MKNIFIGFFITIITLLILIVVFYYYIEWCSKKYNEFYTYTSPLNDEDKKYFKLMLPKPVVDAWKPLKFWFLYNKVKYL